MTDREDTGFEPVPGFDPVDVFPDGELDLRVNADDCYKCSTCDTTCPVAAVDDSFPGPKFQGPEQWRLKRREDADIDSSITDCSNCMRCDSACPTGVPLSQMHNEARGAYVSEQMSRFSRTYWRNRLLANYRTVAWLGSKLPRTTNFVLGSRPVRWLNERLLGVTSEREFPAFATQTFRDWWNERGGAAESRRRAQAARERRDEAEQKRVAYFHGCYANYNTPSIAKAMVRVYEYFGYEVVVPKQGCSGTPMFANGMLDDARRHAETNVSNLANLIEDGYDVICSCTSCSLSLKQEYPELFSLDGIDTVSAHTYEALEYLRIHEDLQGALTNNSYEGNNSQNISHEGNKYSTYERNNNGAENGVDSATSYAYHAPCHARNQGLDRQAVELFREIDGIRIEDVGDSCSGISGTYGWKAEKYERSMAIGEEMFEEMDHATGETGLTECPTCASQMEHGTGYEVRHPLEVLEDVLVDETRE